MDDATFARLTILERAQFPVIAEKFWSQVQQCQHGIDCPYCCWEWLGYRTLRRKNYGEFYVYKQGYRSIQVIAHRLAWQLWHGRIIEDGLWCLHHCDTPPCCNPQHLFLGTHQDNVDDKQRKGRTSKGERHGEAIRNGNLRQGEEWPFARLSEVQVRSRRKLVDSGVMTRAEAARHFGVSWGTARDIIARRTWHHLSEGTHQ